MNDGGGGIYGSDVTQEMTNQAEREKKGMTLMRHAGF